MKSYTSTITRSRSTLREEPTAAPVRNWVLAQVHARPNLP